MSAASLSAQIEFVEREMERLGQSQAGHERVRSEAIKNLRELDGAIALLGVQISQKQSERTELIRRRDAELVCEAEAAKRKERAAKRAATARRTRKKARRR